MMVVLLPECGGCVGFGVAEVRVSSCLGVLSTRVPLMCLRTPIFIGDQAIRNLLNQDF